MRCKFCNEVDENRLIMSSRLVNGRVETIDICLRCFWRDKFVYETEGENGNLLREGCEREISAGSLDSLGLRE